MTKEYKQDRLRAFEKLFWSKLDRITVLENNLKSERDSLARIQEQMQKLEKEEAQND